MKPETFSLDEFLRYGFCGVTFVSSALFASKGSPYLLDKIRQTDGLALFTVAAFATGAAFYSFYRALVYPVIGRISLWLTIRHKQKISIKWRHFLPCCIPQAEYERDKRRWTKRPEIVGCGQLSEWASQIHFLYTLGFSLWLGSVIGVTLLSGTKPVDWFSRSFWKFDYRIGLPSLLFLLAAFMSDIRRRTVEEKLPCEEIEPNGKRT